MANPIAVVGSTSSHGGTIISSPVMNFSLDGKIPATVGAVHHCPISGHGDTQIQNGVVTITIAGKQIAVLNVSMAGCGALINGNGVVDITV